MYRWVCRRCKHDFTATRHGDGVCVKCKKRSAIAELKAFVAEHGRAPVAKEICRSNGLPAYRTVTAHFGSVKKWLETIGLTQRPAGDRIAPYLGGRPPAPKRYTPRRIEPEMRADFQLYKAEMMMELERQCGGDGTIRVIGADPTFLNNRRSA
jgi:hypothetical protein